MATNSKIDPVNAIGHISRIQACAVTLSCGKQVIHNPSMDDLYEMSAEQPSSIITDVKMADPAGVGLSKEHRRVIASFSGQDSGRSAWARFLSPRQREMEKYPHLRDTKDRVERLVREVNFQMMQRELIHTEVFFGKNIDFMGKIHFIVPKEYAKLAFDLNLNFIRLSAESKKVYNKSKDLGIDDLRLVCFPEWVNPVWEGWRSRVRTGDQEQLRQHPEPKRIMMIFDVDNVTAYLLGARYFGEVKKACLTMIWNAAIETQRGMPIHGSSKTIYVARGNGSRKSNGKAPSGRRRQNRPYKLNPYTFITIGLSGSGKSTIGNDPHHEHLDAQRGERIHLGNDDALVVLIDPSDKMSGTVGLENGCYNKSNDYAPDSFYIKTVQSAENVMVAPDEKGKLFLIHQDVQNGNGRVQTAREMLEGADHCLDTPWPDYLVLLMKDETLPPICRIRDTRLLVSMFMCLATKSTSAENIPIDQMGKLKMVPGANPFNTWGLEQEAETLEQMFDVVGCKGLILNTGGFFIDAQSNERSLYRNIPKELSLSFYPLICRGKIKWQTWENFPGIQIPAPGCLDEIYPHFDENFSPLHVKDMQAYHELLRTRLVERQNFLLTTHIDRRFILPLRQALIKLDAADLKQRGPTAHVENIDTMLDTGREHDSL